MNKMVTVLAGQAYSDLSCPFFTSSSQIVGSSLSVLPKYWFKTGGIHSEPPLNIRKYVVLHLVGVSPCGTDENQATA